MTLAVHPSRIVALDPDLGAVRYCRRCDEWWPMDSEFWVIQVRPVGMRNTSRGRHYTLKSPVMGYACRACRREQQSAHWHELRTVAA